MTKIEKKIKLIRLWAICEEWRLLYRLSPKSDAEKDQRRQRMSELSPEITRLENETGARSRNIRSVITNLSLASEEEKTPYFLA